MEQGRTDSPKVQLGCGTLILIAIIVMMFSGGDRTKRMQRQIEQLEEKVDRMEKKIDKLVAAEEARPKPALPKP
jgi:uncharacterized protein Yka (UPF0111/DUF47 family)